MIKWLLISLIALGVLLVGALLAVPLLLDSPAMQAYVQQQASHALGRPVKFGGLSIAALPLPRVRLRQLQVAEEDRKSTRLNSSHQIISYSLFCLKKKNA